MKQFFNTLLYGDAKTRRILWSMTICALLALVLIIIAVLSETPSLFGMALILVAVVVLISQLYDFKQLKDAAVNVDENIPVPPEDILVKYTEKRLHQVFIRFRVRPDHRPVMIDHSEKYKIKETPAYVWVFRGRFHILLIEKNAREIVLPVAAASKVIYRRAVPVNMKGEYVQFRKPSLLSGVFSDYLPDIYDYGQGGIKRQMKNLYVIDEDIALTNRSIKHIFDLTGANFEIEDRITQSGDYGQDFIDMYKAYTLFRDGVLDANEYKKRVTKILDDMAVSNMLDAELTINLEKMQSFHFLTADYAKYCLEKRVKMLNEQKKKRS